LSALLALILCAVAVVLTRTAPDPDLWGHLRFGLDLWRTGSLPATDSYSYLTAGQSWINHEWLAEWFFALAWRVAGTPGLLVFKALIALCTAGLLYREMLIRGVAPLRAALLLLPAAALLRPALGTVRPHLFTALLFAVTLLVLSRTVRGARRLWWALPVVFALWANLHGGFLAGLGVVAVFVIAQFVTGRLGLHRSVLLGLACLAATLITPYGVHLLIFLAETATIPRPEISEWQPLALGTATGAFYLLMVVLAGAGWLYGGRPRSAGLAAVWAVTAVAPLLAERHLALFAIASLALAGEHIAGLMARLWPERPPARIPAGWAALPLAVGFLLIGVSVAQLRAFTADINSLRYPASAVTLLRESGVRGNLAVEFDWGEYVIWHLSPQVQVSVDGRRETTYSEDIYQLNLRFLRGLGQWDALLTRHDTHLALVGRGGPADNLLRLRSGWSLVHQDDLAALFVRRDLPLHGALTQVAADLTLPPNNAGVFP
jgi:hypothetical protein